MSGMKNEENSGLDEFGTEKWVEDTNLDAMLRAQDKFTLERGDELRENCYHLTEEVVKRYLRLREHAAPSAFGAFDRDEIARILTFVPVIEYTGFFYDPPTADAPKGNVYETTWETDASEAWDRSTFIAAYARYLEEAAAFAEAQGVTDAQQAYRGALELVNAAGSPQVLRRALSPDDALRVVDLERRATETLGAAMAGKEAAS